MNNKIKSSLETDEGKIMFCIVREFLEFFNLDCTLSVYEPESYLGNIYQYEGRHMVAEKLGLDVDEEAPHFPLLLMLIRFVQMMKNKNNHRDKISVAREVKSHELNDSKNTTQNLNMTYELSKPTINLCTSNNEVEYIGTPNELNNSENRQSQDSFKCENKPQDSEVAAQPILKESRNNEKPKFDKIKSKSTSETSPFQNNKSRVSDILPSLYNKEYKDKSGIRELDKMFDMEIEYEEDFLHSRDLSLQCDYLRNEPNSVSNNSRKTDSIEIISKKKDNSNELTCHKDHSNNV